MYGWYQNYLKYLHYTNLHESYLQYMYVDKQHNYADMHFTVFVIQVT